MNAANRRMRERSAVDVTNEAIFLLKLEKDQHQRMTDAAWNHDNALTPRGIALVAEAGK